MRWFFIFLIFAGHAFAKQNPIDEHEFEMLMGGEASDSNYTSTAKDFELLEQSKALFQKHKMAQYLQKGGYKIPPVVHFIWLGPRAFPPESVENVRSWIATHPAWTVKFWTDRDRDPPCEGMEKNLVKNFAFIKLGRCFELSQNWEVKSDLLSYEILFQQGGLYVDHDAECLRSFNSMHHGYDFFCALESPHEPVAGRGVTCGNGVLGSRPRHPVMAKVIDLIVERWDIAYSPPEAMLQPSYIAMTEAVEKAIDSEGNTDIIFPAAYFFAKSGMPPLYTRQFFGINKADRKEHSLGKIRKKNRSILFVLAGLVILNGSILGVRFYKRKKT